MIVPQFWAEGRIQEPVAGKQLTVRRYGWSDESPLAAQAHADQRTREAFDRIASGEKLDRRERKLAYNGANGVPIREEIIERQGDAVITRNSYGARCLNTPDVLFVDIDFDEPLRGSLFLFALFPALIAGVVGGWAARTWLGGLIAFFVVFAVAYTIGRRKKRGEPTDNPTPEKQAAERIGRFLHQHPDWHLRIYRTPAGFRVLAMHDVFSPNDAVVADCFQLMGVDKVYARMCRNQNCFRARLSAKPWRIGISEPMRPRPGVWPVSPDRLPQRNAWVTRYEKAAEGHAACQYLESVGNTARLHPSAQAVQELHDERTRANSGFPLA
ncbi:hypothetical protein [Variovorax sp. GB1P17]|uniref:hypothetical protein n=1 Tax=Variovorax sp. GB1P17 TaxID=3443740 RepID=UPI003F462C11